MSQLCTLEILPDRVYNKRSPLIFGVRVLSGELRLDATVFLPDADNVSLGKVTSIEVANRESVQLASVGAEPCIRIESDSVASYLYGRHFSHLNRLTAGSD